MVDRLLKTSVALVLLMVWIVGCGNKGQLTLPGVGQSLDQQETQSGPNPTSDPNDDETAAGEKLQPPVSDSP